MFNRLTKDHYLNCMLCACAGAVHVQICGGCIDGGPERRGACGHAAVPDGAGRRAARLRRRARNLLPLQRAPERCLCQGAPIPF